MHSHPELQFGDHLLESLDLDIERTTIATMEFPWKLAAPRLKHPPRHAVRVESMEREYLDRIEEKMPPSDLIVGIGGGSCIQAGRLPFDIKVEIDVIACKKNS